MAFRTREGHGRCCTPAERIPRRCRPCSIRDGPRVVHLISRLHILVAGHRLLAIPKWRPLLPAASRQGRFHVARLRMGRSLRADGKDANHGLLPPPPSPDDGHLRALNGQWFNCLWPMVNVLRPFGTTLNGSRKYRHRTGAQNPASLSGVPFKTIKK